MEAELWYTPPTNEVFEEVRNKSLEIWNTYDNKYGYADEKKANVNSLNNETSQFMGMVGMFDNANQKKLATKLSEDSKKAIRERMIDGGIGEHYIMF